MSKGKDNDKPMPGKNEISIVRSSAAEYLTFVAAGGSSEASVEMRYEDENLWLTQKMMASLYDVSVPAINQHLKRIFADNELERKATVKPYLIVQKKTNGCQRMRTQPVGCGEPVNRINPHRTRRPNTMMWFVPHHILQDICQTEVAP